MPRTGFESRSSSARSRTSLTPRSTGRVVLNPNTRRPATRRQGFDPATLQAAADAHLAGPIASHLLFPVLNWASQPAYAVGNLIAGHPQESLKNAFNASAPGLSQHYGIRGAQTFPAQALRDRGVPMPGGKLGFVTDLLINAGLDPYSYLTFGGAGAVATAGRDAARGLATRTAERAASDAADRAAAQAAGRAALPLSSRASPEALRDVGSTALHVEEARALVPRALRVGLRIPFSRGRTIKILESTRVPAAAGRAASLVPQSLRDSIRSVSRGDAGTDAALNQAALRIQGVVNRDRAEASRRARDFQRRLDRAAHESGLSRSDAYEIVTHGAERTTPLGREAPLVPQNTPPALAPLVDEMRTMLDDLNRVERRAGISKAEIPDYVPIRLVSQKDRKAYETASTRLYGPGHANLDNPAFVRPRENPTVLAARQMAERAKAEGLPGFNVELNPARLYEVRAHESLGARQKLATDQVLNARSAKLEAQPLPDVGAAAIRAADARGELARLSERAPTAGARRAAQQASRQEKLAAQQLRAAQRTGDPVAVRTAYANLQAAQAAGRAGVERVLGDVVAPALERAAVLGRSQAATRASLGPRLGAERFTVTGAERSPAQLTRLADKMEAHAAKLMAPWEAQIRAAASALWHAPGGRFLSGRRKAHSLAERGYKPGGAASSSRNIPGMHIEDYYDDAIDALTRPGSALAEAEARRLRAARDRSVDLHARATRIRAAHAERSIFGDEALRAVAAAERPQRTVAARARRERAASRGPVPVPARSVASTPRGRALERRYFSPGPRPIKDAITANRSAAEREVAEAVRQADRAVAAAQRRLAAAQRQTSQAVIADARRSLARASATARGARQRLTAARASYVGRPTQVAAATREVVRAERQLAGRQARATRISEDNARRAAAPGTPVSRAQMAERAREGWVEYPSRYFKDHRVSPETAAAIRRIHERISPTVRSEATMSRAAQRIQRITSRWKALALLSPGFHLRNMYDDAFRAVVIADARNPVSYVQAARAMLGKGGTITIRGEKHDLDALLEQAAASGAIDAGFSAREIAEGLGEAASPVRRARRRVSAPGTGRLARGSKAVGDFRENTVRFGTFLERLKAGDDIYQAGTRTREAHFDYGDVGKFVESSRKFLFPFITYTSKAIPATARMIARKPSTFSRMNMLAQELSKDSDVDFSQLPFGQQMSVPVPLPGPMRRLMGVPEGQTVLYNPERTFAFGATTVLDPRHVVSNIGGLANPLASTPVEIATNYDTFRERNWFPNERVWAPQIVQWAHDAGIPIPGYGPKGDKATGQSGFGYAPTLDSLLRLLPLFGQAGSLAPARSDSPQLGPFRYATGLSLNPYDRARAQYWAGRRAQAQR